MCACLLQHQTGKNCLFGSEPEKGANMSIRDAVNYLEDNRRRDSHLNHLLHAMSKNEIQQLLKFIDWQLKQDIHEYLRRHQ